MARNVLNTWQPTLGFVKPKLSETAPWTCLNSSASTSILPSPTAPSTTTSLAANGRHPLLGATLSNVSPITGKPFCKVAQSDAADINLALDAAHAAQEKWGKTSVAERSLILLKIADRMEQNIDLLASAETIDNGKAAARNHRCRCSLGIDHFRYFAGCIRAQEGAISEIDSKTVAYHFNEPIGVVGQIIPWNFPLLMAGWKLAPALAAGNCVVLKPPSTPPSSILVLTELIADLLPPGRAEHRQRLRPRGRRCRWPPASALPKLPSPAPPPWASVILHAAADNLIPATVELGGKSPNIFFADVMDADDEFFWTRRSRAWCCSPSTKAKSAPAHRACADPRIDLRALHGTRHGPGRSHEARPPAGHPHHGRSASVASSSSSAILGCTWKLGQPRRGRSA